MGHTAVSDIESSSVTLLTLRKEPDENTAILLILTGQSTQKLIQTKLRPKNLICLENESKPIKTSGFSKYNH